MTRTWLRWRLMIAVLFAGVLQEPNLANSSAQKLPAKLSIRTNRVLNLFQCKTMDQSVFTISVETSAALAERLVLSKAEKSEVIPLRDAHQQVFPSSDEHGTVIAWKSPRGMIYLFLELVSAPESAEGESFARSEGATTYKASLRVINAKGEQNFFCREGEIEAPNTGWLGPTDRWPAPLNIWSLQAVGLAQPLNPGFDLDDWPRAK